MTRDDLVNVFALLRGYWPHSCPSIDSQFDVAAYRQEMAELDFDDVIDAVRLLAKTNEFCPTVGILAEAARTGPPKVPPYYAPIPIEAPTTIASPEVVAEAIAEARASLRASGVPVGGTGA